MLKYVPQLAQKKIVLASASPRRTELLKQLGLKFEVRSAAAGQGRWQLPPAPLRGIVLVGCC